MFGERLIFGQVFKFVFFVGQGILVGLDQVVVGRVVVVGGRGWSFFFLGCVLFVFYLGVSFRYYFVSVRGSELGFVFQGFRSRLRILRVLCCWFLGIQNMVDGAQVNFKGFRKKVLVSYFFGRRGLSFRVFSFSRIFRYVFVILGRNFYRVVQGWGGELIFRIFFFRKESFEFLSDG